MITVKQAVILCGGLGTRLGSLTKQVPKPMIRIHGRPFLEYLVSQLKRQGITEVILLTGFLGETIREYFGGRYQQCFQISKIVPDPQI